MAKSGVGPPPRASISKGCARRIRIVLKAIPRSARLEFDGPNLVQVVEVLDSRDRIRCHLCRESSNHA